MSLKSHLRKPWGYLKQDGQGVGLTKVNKKAQGFLQNLGLRWYVSDWSVKALWVVQTSDDLNSASWNDSYLCQNF